jgi:MFS family permease
MMFGPENPKLPVEVSSPAGFAPTIPEIIEEIGFGKGQIVTLIFACGVFFAEGVELLLVSFVSDAITRDLVIGDKDYSGHLPHHHQATVLQDGFIISAIFAGAFLGNLLSGLTVNKVGCQFLIIFGYALIVIFSVSSSFMNSLLSISVFRFFVGMGFGVGQPAAIVLTCEVLPKRCRFLAPLCAACFFGAGAIFAVFMVMFGDVWVGPNLVQKVWRLLLRCGALPILILGFGSVFFLLESPSFLADTCDHALARDYLAVLRSRNKRPEVSVMFRGADALPSRNLPPQSFSKALELATLPFTLVVCTTVLVLCFALYGASYAVPQVLTELLGRSWSHNNLAPTSVLFIALFLSGIMLPLTSFCKSSTIQKTWVISLCLLTCVFSTLLFNWITGLHSANFFHRFVLVVACFGLCSGPAVGLVLLAQATIALYPGLLSTANVAACFCLGRLAPIVGPLLFDNIVTKTGTGKAFFSTMMVLELINVALLLPMQHWSLAEEESPQEAETGLRAGLADEPEEKLPGTFVGAPVFSGAPVPSGPQPESS